MYLLADHCKILIFNKALRKTFFFSVERNTPSVCLDSAVHYLNLKTK